MAKFDIKVFRKDGSPVTSLDAMPVDELKQIRFELLVSAGHIKQRIFDITGEEMFYTMDRIFVVVTPVCPHYPGRKVGSKECTQCDHFRGGIVQNFVDCEHNRPEIEQKTPKPARKAAEIAQPAKKRGRPAKKAISKPVKTRKKKNG